MIEMLLFGSAVVPPLPDPHIVISEPCVVAAELGYDNWLSTCEGAEPLASGLGDQVETGGFKFRLEEGEIVGPGITFGYVAQFDQGINRASVVVGLVCVDSVTGEIEGANSSPSELWLLRDHEGLATGWVTVSTDGQCSVGQRRDIVVLSVQSTSDTPWREAGPAAGVPGWQNGVNEVTHRVTAPNVFRTLRWEVLSAPDYGESGNVNVKVTCVAVTYGESGPVGGYAPVTLFRTNGVQVPGSTINDPVCNSPAHVGNSVTTTRSVAQFGFLAARYGGESLVEWRPVGHPDRYEPTDRWWTSGTVTAFEPVDEIIWLGRPADPTVSEVAGLCESGEISACVDRCMDLFDPSWLPWETAASFIDFVRCLLVPQASLPAVIGAAVDDLRASTTWQVVDVSMNTFIDSSTLPSQYALPCGRLLTVDMPLGADVEVGTCGVPPTFTKVVYWTSTVLMSLAFAFGIVYLVFWALNWRMPFNAPDSGEED